MAERINAIRAAVFGGAPQPATRPQGDRGRLTQPSAPAPTKTLYFAYGSNLQLAQMAQRCPSSKFVGRGVLHDFRWQISSRGYANVVAEPGSRVEGLIFILANDDEQRLDRSEGVSKGSYRKEYHPVRFYLAAKPLYLRSVTSIVRQGGPRAMLEEARRQRKDLSVIGPLEDSVLVYLNLEKTQDGPPLTEYIDRINLGVQDATALGMRPEFVHRVIRRYVPASQPPRDADERTGRVITAAPPAPSPKRKSPMEQSHEPRILRRIAVEPPGQQGMISTQLGADRAHGQSGPSRRRSRRRRESSPSRPWLERFFKLA